MCKRASMGEFLSTARYGPLVFTSLDSEWLNVFSFLTNIYYAVRGTISFFYLDDMRIS